MHNHMYKCILVPIDLGEPDLAKPAIAAALMMANQTGAVIRLVHVLPLTPAMLAEYVPADFESQQRKTSEEALGIIANEIGLGSRVSCAVRHGGVHQEILEEAKAAGADLVVMSSHRHQKPGVRTNFMGSDTGHVVRYAKCSVFVVRS